MTSVEPQWPLLGTDGKCTEGTIGAIRLVPGGEHICDSTPGTLRSISDLHVVPNQACSISTNPRPPNGMEALKARIAEAIQSDVFPTAVLCVAVCLVAFAFFLLLFRDVYLRWHSGSEERRVLRELRKRARSRYKTKR